MEQILTTAVSYVDTAMVGHIGPDASAAVGVTMTVNWLINGTVSALGIGFLAYIARAVGARAARARPPRVGAGCARCAAFRRSVYDTAPFAGGENSRMDERRSAPPL